MSGPRRAPIFIIGASTIAIEVPVTPSSAISRAYSGKSEFLPFGN